MNANSGPGVERLSLREVVRRLRQQGIPSAKGTRWRGAPEQSRSGKSRSRGVPEDQITIPVPAIVSAELFQAVGEQMQRRHVHLRLDLVGSAGSGTRGGRSVWPRNRPCCGRCRRGV